MSEAFRSSPESLWRPWKRFLLRIDGCRSVAQLCAAGDEAETRHLLQVLVGEVLDLRGPTPPTAAPLPPKTEPSGKAFQEIVPPKTAAPEIPAATSAPPTPRRQQSLLILGNGQGARQLLERLEPEMPDDISLRFLEVSTGGGSGSLPRKGPSGKLETLLRASSKQDSAQRFPLVTAEEIGAATLVLHILEGLPGQAAFEFQATCFAAGVAALGVELAPDGVRVGPTVIPGLLPPLPAASTAREPTSGKSASSTACAACARLAALGGLGLTGPQRVALAQRLSSSVLEEGSRPFAIALQAAAQEAFRMCRGMPPTLLDAVLHIPRDGSSPRRYPIPLGKNCPVCAEPQKFRRDPLAVASRRELLGRREQDVPRIEVTPAARPPRIGILGGGTAGYLTALALRRRRPQLPVTVIESSSLPTIGVGEATTPFDASIPPHRSGPRYSPIFPRGPSRPSNWGFVSIGRKPAAATSITPSVPSTSSSPTPMKAPCKIARCDP